jgi:hypothetical protein
MFLHFSYSSFCLYHYPKESVMYPRLSAAAAN